jgi:hypothetical protein
MMTTHRIWIDGALVQGRWFRGAGSGALVQGRWFKGAGSIVVVVTRPVGQNVNDLDAAGSMAYRPGSR